MKPRYRIVTDRLFGYAVQVWRWWWPFWCEPHPNSHNSVEQAEAWARNQFKVVKYLGTIEDRQ